MKFLAIRLPIDTTTMVSSNAAQLLMALSALLTWTRTVRLYQQEIPVVVMLSKGLVPVEHGIDYRCRRPGAGVMLEAVIGGGLGAIIGWGSSACIYGFRDDD